MAEVFTSENCSFLLVAKAAKPLLCLHHGQYFINCADILLFTAYFCRKGIILGKNTNESNVRDITINLISTFNPLHLCGLEAGCPDIFFKGCS